MRRPNAELFLDLRLLEQLLDLPIGYRVVAVEPGASEEQFERAGPARVLVEIEARAPVAPGGVLNLVEPVYRRVGFERPKLIRVTVKRPEERDT